MIPWLTGGGDINQKIEGCSIIDSIWAVWSREGSGLKRACIASSPFLLFSRSDGGPVHHSHHHYHNGITPIISRSCLLLLGDWVCTRFFYTLIVGGLDSFSVLRFSRQPLLAFYYFFFLEKGLMSFFGFSRLAVVLKTRRSR